MQPPLQERRRNARFSYSEAVAGIGRMSSCHRIFIRHDNFPDWDLGITFDADDNIIGFELRAPFDESAPNNTRVPVGGMTRRLLQAIPLGELENHARYFAARNAEDVANTIAAVMELRVATEVENQYLVVGDHLLTPGGGPGSPMHRAALKRVEHLDAEPLPRRPSRPRLEDADVLAAAAMFAQLVADGERAPYRVIAAQLDIKSDKVATLVRTARTRGFLTAAAPTSSGSPRGGAARGQLTEQGLARWRDLLNKEQL